jgi:LmbE family N-acetylglucosaminyl deacetylase|tara:strand:+ start:179 stop:679 length:501 start_codon:yes stop_codon:yes gene_type:complete
MIDKLMITAHPDDEALFGGAELLTHSKEYKVIAVDEAHNHIRKGEFKASMAFIGIEEYEHWTGYKGGEDYRREKLIYELLRVLREQDWKKIVTHNKKGEYGHPRHRALHDILNHLRPEILWQFDKDGERLSQDLLLKKRDLLKVYESQKDVLDWFSPWYEKITKVN